MEYSIRSLSTVLSLALQELNRTLKFLSRNPQIFPIYDDGLIRYIENSVTSNSTPTQHLPLAKATVTVENQEGIWKNCQGGGHLKLLR